jgi:hypothetical protein
MAERIMLPTTPQLVNTLQDPSGSLGPVSTRQAEVDGQQICQMESDRLVAGGDRATRRARDRFGCSGQKTTASARWNIDPSSIVSRIV